MQRQPLLPNYWKIIGIIIITVAIAVQAFSHNTSFIKSASAKEIIKVVTLSSATLGLFFFVWSKDKTEDERSSYLRLRAMHFAVYWVAAKMIFTPLFNLLAEQPVESTSGQSIVVELLITYIIVYQVRKLASA